jgi:FkbM family methyltransferase
MPGKLFNSPSQRLLVTLHRFLSSRLNLHGGLIGKAYRRIYFAYKNITDRQIIAAACKLVKTGTWVVDVGANIGFFSMALARRENVRLLAFEPDDRNFQNLMSVIADGGLRTQVHPYALALSDKTGSGLLYLSDFSPMDHKLIDSRSSRNVEIAITRLDDFLAAHPQHVDRPVSLIKIDVQGAELHVLRGMHQTLVRNNYPPILVEYAPDDLRQAGVTPEDFFSAFEALGYRPHALPELSRRPPSWFIDNLRGAYTDLAMIRSLAPG